MNIDGSEQKNLTNNPAYYRKLSFSPDGKKIAFLSDGDVNVFGHSDIYVMNADGTKRRNLTKHRAWEGKSYWSPLPSKQD